jgi:hypothetical protein
MDVDEVIEHERAKRQEIYRRRHRYAAGIGILAFAIIVAVGIFLAVDLFRSVSVVKFLRIAAVAVCVPALVFLATSQLNRHLEKPIPDFLVFLILFLATSTAIWQVY